jgi:hypothetical protein
MAPSFENNLKLVKDLDLDLDFELVIREIFFPILNFNFG